MKIKINFFAEPSEPNVKPSLIACPTGDFASLEEARPIALADGNKPAIMAHSIIIDSLDDASLSEQWIRDSPLSPTAKYPRAEAALRDI
jgi:hypothetical protein